MQDLNGRARRRRRRRSCVFPGRLIVGRYLDRLRNRWSCLYLETKQWKRIVRLPLKKKKKSYRCSSADWMTEIRIVEFSVVFPLSFRPNRLAAFVRSWLRPTNPETLPNARPTR